MELPLVLDVMSTAAVIVGVVFGLNQLQQYRAFRKRESALFLLNSYQTPLFLEGIWTLMSVPDGLTMEQIEEALGDEIGNALLVMSTLESIAILVFHREITMDMVDDAYSGPIILSWQKLEPYVLGLREQYQRETIFEWFQWLAERMRDREQLRPPVPAHIAHRGWTE